MLELKKLFDESINLLKNKHYKLAISGFEKILITNPKHANTLFLLARCYAGLQDFLSAIKFAQLAIKIAPNELAFHLNLGFWYNAISEHEKSLQKLLPLIEYFSNDPALFAHIGNAYRRLNKGKKSLYYTEIATHLASKFFIKYWNKFCNNRYELKFLHECKTWYDYQQIYHQDLSRSYLSLSDLKQSWNFSESRKYQSNYYNDLLLRYQYWKGENLKNKTLLILPEQGIGDELIFATTFNDISRLAKKCLIACDPRLTTLFKRSLPKATILGLPRDEIAKQDLSHVDTVCLAGSILKHTRSNLYDFPKQNDWIQLDANRKENWRRKLDEIGPGIKIGLSWRSLKNRNIAAVSPMYPPLHQLTSLFQLPNIHWINLQYDEINEEKKWISTYTPLHTFDNLDYMNDFDELSHLISNLDLCLLPMNSLFSLAGLCGAKIWLFAPLSPMITLCGGQESPFFPSTRVYQKTDFTDWRSVIQRMRKDLQALING